MTFTASNGYKVDRLSDGQTKITRGKHGVFEAVTWCGGDEYAAIAEHAQHERDEALGRWRSDADPDFVVYPSRAGVVRVLRESTGKSFEYISSELTTTASAYGVAAREYFDAHPEPKPWYTAKDGEVWALTTPATGERAYQVVRTEEAGFRFFLITGDEGFRPGLFPEEAQIKSGRRIWPEVTP